MNYWIFTVTQKRINNKNYAPDEILQIRLADKFWGLSEKTPNRKNLQVGDWVLFYVGIPFAHMAASATLSSISFALNESQKKSYSHDDELYRTDYGVTLENIQVWETPRSVKEIVPGLKFIENKTNWGAYFQGGVRQISEEDFLVIQDKRRIIQPELMLTEDDLVSESQFALEAHLEEFMSNNWSRINFGDELVRYSVDEQNGQQFPAGPWSIDFLCTDRRNNDFVVIELKRGKSSDSTVGQVLRYIGWVKQNLARNGQKVRGIIICKEVDDALRYAVSPIENVSIMTYEVDFKLKRFAQ